MQLTSDFHQLYAEGAFVWGDYANNQEKKTGKKVIRLQIGQPDFPPHEIIVKNIAQAYLDKKTGYGPPLGLDIFRQAVAEEIQPYYQKAKITKENVAITAGGGKTAIGVICRAILSPNDLVLVPCYGYPGHLSGITDAKAKYDSYRLIPEKDYDVDIIDLEAKIKKLNPKVIFLLSPGNPTGGIIKKETMEKIAWLIHRYNLIAVTDEIYRAHVFDGQFISILDFPHMPERTIVIDGPGKRNCLTGARIGYIIGAEKFIDIAVRKINNLRFSCPPMPEQVGLAQSINKKLVLDYMKKMRQEFKKRRDYLVEKLNQIKGIFCPKPGGAFYCFADISQTGYNGETFAKKLLQEKNVCVLPGESFGGGVIDKKTGKPYGYYHIRISFAASMADLAEALNRIKNFLKNN
jgi:aspartate/methionine/tyrosine aminotransferase